MTIKLQGKWEAERVAHALEYAAMLTATEPKMVPWMRNCAERIKRQVEQEKKRSETKRCCATCKWLDGMFDKCAKCTKNNDIVVLPYCTHCRQWRMK